MNTLRQIFVGNKGIWVALAMLLSKVSAFIITIITAHFINSKELGEILYALNFLGFFIPMVGFGSYQGTLRYGSLNDNLDEKKQLFRYSFYQGFLMQVLLTIVMVALSFVFIKDLEIIYILLLFSVRLFGLFVLEQAKAEKRASGDNKNFALIDVYYSVFSIVITTVLTYFFGSVGYIVALCISPLSIFLNYRISFNKETNLFVNKKEFWNYNILTAFTLQIWQWIFLVDVFFVGYFFSKEDVSFYKISAMIPFNLLFLSQVIMQTEYHNFCKNAQDKNYFVNFLKNYWKLMVVISILILTISFLFSDYIMMIFGKNYRDPTIFKILIFGSISSLFLRVPFGNLLAAIGKSQYNLVVSLLSLVLLAILCTIFYQDYGLKGIAFSSVITLSVSGIALALLFFSNFKPSKPSKT